MPLYDYRCEECLKSFEIRHGLDEGEGLSCPFCGEPGPQKLMRGCNVSTSSDYGPEMEHVAMEQSKNVSSNKARVEKALGNMVGREDKKNQETGHSGCVKETRIELEDRYGKIFD